MKWLTVAGTFLALGLAPAAFATNVTMTFGTLPSAQGWSLVTSGVSTEGGTFAAWPDSLTMHTLGDGLPPAGSTAYYQQTGVITGTEPVSIEVRARVIQHEGEAGNAFIGGGFAFGFGDGATLWQLGVTPTELRNAAGTVLSTSYDNTQFHDYRLEWSPPSTLRYYVDGTLISSDGTGLALPINRIHLGDVTGSANAFATVTSYQFLQGVDVATTTKTWGRLKALYR